MNGESPQTVHYKNDLRRLTVLIGCALTLFGAVLIAVVAFAGLSANGTAIDRGSRLVQNALDQAVSRVLDEQRSIAWWDDAVLNLARPDLNTEWAAVEVGAFLSETYHHNQVFVLNEQDEPVYAYVDGEAVEPRAAFRDRRVVAAPVIEAARRGHDQLRARTIAFDESGNRYRELMGEVGASWSGHILAVDGQPAVVAAISIVPNVDVSLASPTPYLLVSVAPIDQAFMDKVGVNLLLRDLTLTAAPRRGEAVTSQPFAADDGSPLGYLSWTTRRPGQPILLFILPLVILGVLLAGAGTTVMILRLKRASAEIADREAEARFESLHDALSGLPNRRHFVAKLQDRLDAFVQTRNGARIVVAYLDVDRFKDINDTLGHHAGDAVIRAVSERLRRYMGPNDFLVRLGGDEFAIMRFGGAGDEHALVARLREAFDECFDVLGQCLMMTATVGVAVAPDHGLSPEELMRAADIALYQGKSQGRDRAMFFCAEMAAEVEQRREIEVALQEALIEDALNLHYQPLVSSQNGTISGVEALLRWRHPVKGDMSPALFVPIAEEAGLMPALGAWVLERAFKDSARWPGLEIAINLSPVQFRHMDLVALLQRLILRHNVDPSRIVLEVTEGVLMESTDRNRSILESIRDLGFKIALDDFGTGYSSLRYLSDFRFDKIKIDRAFVTNIDERKRAMTIIQSVVALGRNFGMSIVAEGVETQAEAQVMRLLGVSELQGYLFSRPTAPEEIAGLRAAFAERAEAAPEGAGALVRSAQRS